MGQYRSNSIMLGFRKNDFKGVVDKAWEEFSLEGNHHKLYYLMKKLKFVKAEITKWDKKRREDHNQIRIKSLKSIEEIDKKVDAGTSMAQDLDERAKALETLWNQDKQEQESQKQKQKNKWCLEGDENSRLFHRNLNKKKRKAGIKGILKDGTWQTEPNQVKLTFFEHFQERFSRNQEQRWNQDLTNIKQLTEEHKAYMEGPFTEEEIKNAVWDCGREKSPGPDGFNVEF